MALFDVVSDLLATLDRAGKILDVNPAWQKTLGWTREELIGTRAVDLLHPEDRERTLALAPLGPEPVPDVVSFENRYLRKGGGYRWLQWNARLLGDVWYSVARDVTERRVLEQRAVHDPLTGLPNRMALIERLGLALGRLTRRPGCVAVLFVDLDHFKVVNDGRGHEVGDRFLRAAASRLQEAARGIDVVARFGGDEFVVLLEELGGPLEARQIAERFVAALERPLCIDGEELAVGASIGIAVTDTAATMPETLLREADIAMYRAKAVGGQGVELFDERVREQVRSRVVAETELRAAVEGAGLVLHYQPIVALPEMSVDRYEALLRWQHPQRGLLLPDQFLALAEETSTIVPIGEWVLREACGQACRWRRDGRDVAITVNVSTRQLDEADFADVVRSVLAETGLPPAALCLEITETEIMNQIERVAPALEVLQRVGVQIAMDDFGSGYSSLTYLRSLPLDIIKVDKSFVSGIATNPQDRAIVAGIVRLGAETQRSVIAEGVETEALHVELLALGADLAQGFFYDVPRPPDELALGGYNSRIRPGVGDPTVLRGFMRQGGVPARVER